MPFEFTKLDIDGLVIVQPRVFADERGFFLETYKNSDFKNSGINVEFGQDNHSYSTKGVLRGLHFQKPPSSQAKLIRVIKGAVWDVAVDMRKNSPTFLKWYGIELSEENNTMFYVPEGFAHGFITLSDKAHLMYKCSKEYDPSTDSGIRWDDPDVGVKWPMDKPLLSPKDEVLPYLKDAYKFD